MSQSASGPLIVTALLGHADQAWADGLRRRFYPADRNQVPAHLTLFHQLPPSCEGELRTCLSAAARMAPPIACVDRLLDLGGGVALHVMSEGLAALREELVAHFQGLLTAQDRHRPRFHITIQNKVSQREARETLAQLSAGFRARPLALHGLACWRYLDGPWSLVARFHFRG